MPAQKLVVQINVQRIFCKSEMNTRRVFLSLVKREDGRTFYPAINSGVNLSSVSHIGDLGNQSPHILMKTKRLSYINRVPIGECVNCIENDMLIFVLHPSYQNVDHQICLVYVRHSITDFTVGLCLV